MVRKISIGVMLIIGAVSTPAAAGDVLIWQPVKDGYRTLWVSVDGAKITTIATRSEAVVSDGHALWALRMTSTPLPLYACEAMENDAKGAKSEGTFAWPSLTALDLTGSGRHTVVEPWGKEPFYGEVWSKSIRLTGSVGPYVMLEHINTGFACGAHGYDDSNMFVWHVLKKATSEPSTLVKNEAQVRKAPVAALLHKAQEEECVEDDDMSRRSIFLDGLSLDADGSEVSATAHYVHPTGASWMFACTIPHDLALKEDQLSRRLTPTEGVKRVLAALKITGTVGYAHLNLTGEKRAAALDAFKTRALPNVKRTRANADAAPLINKGRKLTGAKKYAAAISAFTTAIRKDPKAARAWSGRGYARLLAGQLDKAARDFDHALTLDATDVYHAAVWFNLGKIAEKQGKLKPAKRAYAKANRLKPSKAAEKALKAVQKKLKK